MCVCRGVRVIMVRIRGEKGSRKRKRVMEMKDRKSDKTAKEYVCVGYGESNNGIEQSKVE